jgi:hypothetical protein
VSFTSYVVVSDIAVVILIISAIRFWCSEPVLLRTLMSLAVIGRASSSGTIGGRRLKLLELSQLSFWCVCLARSNEDWFDGGSEGSGSDWRGSGVSSVGGDIVDGQLGLGVSSGWYTGDIGWYIRGGDGARGCLWMGVRSGGGGVFLNLHE